MSNREPRTPVNEEVNNFSIAQDQDSNKENIGKHVFKQVVPAPRLNDKGTDTDSFTTVTSSGDREVNGSINSLDATGVFTTQWGSKGDGAMCWPDRLRSDASDTDPAAASPQPLDENPETQVPEDVLPQEDADSEPSAVEIVTEHKAGSPLIAASSWLPPPCPEVALESSEEEEAADHGGATINGDNHPEAAVYPDHDQLPAVFCENATGSRADDDDETCSDSEKDDPIFTEEEDNGLLSDAYDDVELAVDQEAKGDGEARGVSTSSSPPPSSGNNEGAEGVKGTEGGEGTEGSEGTEGVEGAGGGEGTEGVEGGKAGGRHWMNPVGWVVSGYNVIEAGAEAGYHVISNLLGGLGCSRSSQCA